ncbi:hypothetical protein U9M48_012764 [Paspalum notatum var. saurae]|uniref:DCD domain-containing protein n=1 Tax=Paspalum notatum var. saurae TaxID=547442 RepID=A0AAQ3T0V7_PASNO
MRRQGPVLSFRQDAAGDMAGAIFMSNTLTREQCFRASVFGLPAEYQSFVSNVRKGMPLFLFDHTLRKLYGVFEAVSDGGLNIDNAAFQSIHRSYPAQVRIRIIWKCRPLSEDEFFPAIEDNYYQPRKFYFDLSYKQVVRLYELFDDRRVERPIHDYMKNENLETKCSTKGTLDEESSTPCVPHSNDQSHILDPNISDVVRRYSTTTTTTRLHADLPLNVEAHPNMSTPLGTEIFEARVAPTHSCHDQIELFSESELLPAASITDAVSTQISAYSFPTSRHYQLDANQSYPLPPYCPQNTFLSGSTTLDPTEGAKLLADQSYPSARGYLQNGFSASGYTTHNPTCRSRSHLNSTFTPYDHLYPRFSLSNPQSNYDYQVHCDICCNQGCSDAQNDIYACEHRCLNGGEALALPKLSQQGISTCPEVLERDEKTLLAIDQQQRNATDYIQTPDCCEDFDNDQMKHGTHSNALDASCHDNDIVDPQQTQHAIGSQSNTKDQCSPPQISVFSRLSVSKQPSQEVKGPILSQLVSSLSQKTEQWSRKNKQIADDIAISQIGEQAMECSHEELNLPNHLELEEESIEPQIPFLNFKRRSEAGKVDANLGKEISGKVKRRRLVRPSFGENNTSTNVGEELKGNFTHDKDPNLKEVSESHFDIDLNIPAAPLDSCPLEDNRIVVCPSVDIKAKDEKQHGMNKPHPSHAERTKEQDPSGATAQKVSIDFNITGLNTMCEAELRTMLNHASLLLQSFGKIESGESNNSEEAGSTGCVEDRKVSIAVNSDGGHQT